MKRGGIICSCNEVTNQELFVNRSNSVADVQEKMISNIQHIKEYWLIRRRKHKDLTILQAERRRQEVSQYYDASIQRIYQKND